MFQFQMFLFLGICLPNYTICIKNSNIFFQIHPAIVEIYDIMNSGNKTAKDVNKVLAISGRVKEEDPCRVAFKIPRPHHLEHVLKIDLHLKVIYRMFIQCTKLSYL